MTGNIQAMVGGYPSGGTVNSKSIQLVRASSQYLTIADTASLSVTGDLTIEGYFYVTTAPGSGIAVPLVMKGDYNTHNSYQFFYQDTAGTKEVMCRIFGTDGNTDFCSSKVTKTLTLNTWFHVAVIVTVANGIATKFEFVFDGTSAGNGTTSTTGTTPTAIVDLTVGLGVGNSNPATVPTTYCFDGLISNVRVWNVARTAAQINTNKNTVIASATGLVASWTLDNALTDGSGNANTLTNNGTATYSTTVPF